MDLESTLMIGITAGAIALGHWYESRRQTPARTPVQISTNRTGRGYISTKSFIYSYSNGVINVHKVNKKEDIIK